jgi:short-subunit dehydrogenase
VLPHMLERRRGGLLVIGSGAGLALMPNAAAYTASKHYLHGLTQSLRAELDGTGVTVTEVCPGPVNTDFDTAAGIPQTTGGPGRWLRITAEQCAAEALAGFERGQPLIFPGRAYRTLGRVAPLAPLRAQRFAVTRATRRSRAPRDPAPKRTPTTRPTERPNPPGMGAPLRVLVVGATGKLGQAIVRQALHRGHAVTALTREPQAVAQLPALRVLRGDVLAPETLDAALAGQNAVICALGTPSPRKPSTLLHDGTQNLIDAMNRTGVRRLVCVTLLGVGESHRNASLTYRKLILPMLSPMLPDKQRQDDAIRASDLEWVIVRPPRFVGGKPTGTAQIIPDGQPGRVGKVIREDLASILLDLATNDQFVRHIVIVGSRRT